MHANEHNALYRCGGVIIIAIVVGFAFQAPPQTNDQPSRDLGGSLSFSGGGPRGTGGDNQ